MSDTLLWIFIGLGLILAVGLLIFCIRSWQRLKHLKEQARNTPSPSASKPKEIQLKAVESIKIIAQCMLDEQMELSEGCIRIKVLLDHVAPEFHDDPYFKVFAQIYDATRHMPTHEARKEADKKLIMRLDLERMTLEEDNKEAILSASRQLLSRLT